MKAKRKVIFAIGTVAIILSSLLFTNHAVTPKEVTWKDTVAEAQKGGYQIITVDELWQRYTAGVNDLILVDTRQEWEYRTGHIKGSVNFSMEPTWLSRWRKKGALETLLGSDKNRFIVFY